MDYIVTTGSGSLQIFPEIHASPKSKASYSYQKCFSTPQNVAQLEDAVSM